jgi:uncharacterized protein involved in outer membrane biogenesis
LLRFLLIALPLLLGLALGAAWVVPDMMDWDRYRATIEGLASSALGRPVRIDGRITLELLPEPLLTAAEVHMDADSGVELSARELRLAIAPAALLQGTIDARELVLHDPVMRLPWPLPPGTLSFRRPPWLAALSARVEGGRLTVGAVTFTSIDATLSAGDAAGVYRLAGTARRDGNWRFTARLSSPGRDGAAGLDLTLDGMDARQGLGLRFAGYRDAEGMLAGRLDAQGPDLSRVLPVPAVPFHASGRLTLASGLVAADDLALDFGGSPARGAVALRLLPHPRLDLAVAAGRLDLDAWLPALLQAPSAAYPVGVDLSAEAAPLAGGMLRRLRVAFDVAAADDALGKVVPAGTVALREVSAILPGDATLTLAGMVQRAEGGRPTFDGQASLSAPDFRTTLLWLEKTVLRPLSGLPSGVLQAVDVSARVRADAGRIALEDVHGQVDGAGVDSTLALGLTPRLSLVGNVTTDRLNLDRWIGPSWSDSPALPTFNVALRLAAEHAAWQGADIAPLAADVAFENGALQVHNLTGAVQGVQVQLSGSLGEGGRVSDGQLQMVTKDAAALMPLLPPALRIPALWRGAAALHMEAAGPSTALVVKAAGELGDLRLEAQPVVDVLHWGWVGPLTLRHPGAPRLLETLGWLGAPAWLGDGSFSLVAGLSANAQQIHADKLDVVAGSLRASAQLLLEGTGGAQPMLSGHIAAETLPLPEIYPRALEPLPLGWLRDVRAQLQITADQVLIGLSPVLDRAAAALSVLDGVVKLDELKASLAGGDLSGTAALDLSLTPPRLQVAANLAGATLHEPVRLPPVALLSGGWGGGVTLTATGYSPAALLATMAGDVHVSVDDGMLSGFDLAQVAEVLRHDGSDATLTAALTTGTTRFDHLTAQARLEHGRAQLQAAHLQGEAGAVDFSGDVDVAGSALDVQATMAPAFVGADVPDAPHPGLRLTGPFESLRRIPVLTDVAGWRAAGAKP